MIKEYIQQQKEDFNKLTEQLQDMQYYIKEINIRHCFDTFTLAFLIIVVLQTFLYLLYGPILSDLDKTLYMFSLLISPSAFFLLLLHLYELYGLMKKGQKSIPLTLDLMYFIYVVVSFATMIGLSLYYQHHYISQRFLTTGWIVGGVLLCVYVLLALFSAKCLVRLFISKKLPHFFEPSHKKLHRRPRTLAPRKFKPVFKPKQNYYFREKPDVSPWQNEEFFVRYK